MDPIRLRGLNPDEFERLCLEIARSDWPSGKIMRRGSISDPDQSVDIEASVDHSLFGIQCKTGRLTLSELQKLYDQVKRYPHRLDRYILMCAQHPLPSVLDAVRSRQFLLSTHVGQVGDIEIYDPDHIASRLDLMPEAFAKITQSAYSQDLAIADVLDLMKARNITPQHIGRGAEQDEQSWRQLVEKLRASLSIVKKAVQDDKLLSYQEFDRISKLRRELCLLLDNRTLAFALGCSLQHGKHLPFWCRVNSTNPESIEVIQRRIVEQYGRRPFLRAGYALERLSDELKPDALTLIEQYVDQVGDIDIDFMSKTIAAVRACRVVEFWKEEVITHPTYGAVVSEAIREASEPDD